MGNEAFPRTMTDTASTLAKRPLTPHAALKRVIILVNPLSGGVGPGAAAEAEAMLAEYELEATVTTLEGTKIPAQIGEALEAGADAVFVLAGDGTARSVATRAGPDGPLVAPLPGGTMNMLPKALYGTGDWKVALRRALEEGVAQPVSGGRIDAEEAFFCAAILGSPALWAPAREAMRTGKLKLAWMYARRAFNRAFSGRIRFALDAGEKQKSEALVLICPLISKVMDEPVGLEAAAMNTSDAAQAFRLAAHALFDDWRHDPEVTTRPARKIAVWARSRIPAVIDGEPVLLRAEAKAVFIPRAFMALAPRRSPPEAATDVRA